MFEFELFYPILVFFSGLIAGMVNIMAGGGSVVTLGVLILLGMDASVANGTNRIGLMIESTSGVMAFRSEKYSEFRQSFYLAFFTLPGAILGSVYAINISNQLFQRILAVIMILILVSLFLPRSAGVSRLSQDRRKRLLIYPAMVLIGFYGGFVQVGIGFILMAALRHILGLDLIRVNMHKTFVIFVYTIPILLIFGLTGNIDWFYAAWLAAGYALGAWWSAKLSIAKGEKVVKIVLGIAIVIMATRFFLPG